MKAMQKKYGKAAIFAMDDKLDFKVEAIPTGCYQLDEALGCGGLPKGRIIELFGQESAGKSLMSMFFMAQIQRMGGTAALIDAEFSFNSDFARTIGLDTNKLIVSQPSTLEEAVDMVDNLAKTGAVDIIVVDSVASMVPRKELEGEEIMGDTMALQARQMNKALRILTGSVAKSKVILIFINQLREKVGIVWGAKEYTPGGKALKFYSSLRLQVSKGEKIEKDKIQVGNWLKIKVVKNKVGYPFREAQFELYYDAGIDLVGSLLDFCVMKGVVVQNGSSYLFGDKKLGLGRERAKETIRGDEVLKKELTKQALDKLKESLKNV